MDNTRILNISDLHFPYAHPDCLDFLLAIKKKYNPTRIICGGDEVDNHGISFHSHNVDLDSAGIELRKSIGYIETLADIFPKMDILESNHTSLWFRKALLHGLPTRLMRSYREVLEAPKTWKWHPELILKLPNGHRCKWVHGAGSNILSASQTAGMSLVQFHHHSLFEIRYWNNRDQLNFAMTSGCLLDDKSLSFAYNKLFLKAPIIGVSMVNDSHPLLIPMRMNKKQRWSGEL